jgi:ankyrin repeat protein
MDRVNHLWPDIAALTPKVGLAWCGACQCTVPRKAVLTGTSWASRRCKALGREPDPACAGVAAFLNRTFALQFRDRAHALRWAAEHGHVDVLQFLKGFGLTPEDARSYNNYALRYAAMNGHLDVLQFLKDFMDAAPSGSTAPAQPGAVTNTKYLTLQDVRSENNAALHWAARNGHIKVLQFLKGFGLTLQDVRSASNRALRWAAEKGHVNVLQFLISFSLTLEDMRSDFNYALRRAAENGHVGVLQFLTGFGLTLEDVRSYNNYALGWAAHNGHVAVLQFLKSFGLTLEDVRSDNNYALRWAARNGHVAVLQFLKDNWDLTLQDARADDNCALRWAAEKGHVDVLQFLKSSWNLTLQDVRSNDNYALRWAASCGHVGVLQFLKDFRDPDGTIQGSTAQATDTQRLTLQDVCSRDDHARRWAAINGHVVAVQFLDQWLIELS